eukprot:Opistho-2@4893
MTAASCLPRIVHVAFSVAIEMQFLPKVLDGALNAHGNGRFGRPAENRPRARYVRLPLLRVIGRCAEKLDGGLRRHNSLYHFGKVQDRVFVRVSNVDRLRVVAVHQQDEPVDEVGHILKRSRLLARPVDGDGLPLQRLYYEVADHAPIVRVHPGPKRVEYSRHTHVHFLLLCIRIAHGLCNSLALVVAGARPDRVHVTPVGFLLRMLFGVAIHLRRRRKQQPRAHTPCEAEHVQRAHGVCFDRLDWVVLIVRRRGGRREVIDLVNLKKQRLSDVVVEQLEIWVPNPVVDVLLASRVEVVHHHHLVTLQHQHIDKMRPDKPRAARHENSLTLGSIEVLDDGVFAPLHVAL